MEDDSTLHSVADLIESGSLFINDGYRAKNSELSATGIPFVRVANIKNGFHFENADRFPTEDLHKVGSKISEPGDVVFTSKGTVGRFAFVDRKTSRFVYSPQICFWRSLNPKLIHPRWLYYWMQGLEFRVQYRGVAGQTDMADFVSLRDQRNMKMSIPPLPEQQTIAHILGTLDDKIELNRRMNETLEAIARAIFKSWFVDFEPIPGIGPHEEWVEKDSHKIPKGWKLVNLPEAIKVNPKRQLTKGVSSPYLEMKNMPTSQARAQKWEFRDFKSGVKFQNGDTLLARITPCLENGKTAFVDFLNDEQTGWGSTEYIVFCSKPPLPKEYSYFLCRQEDFRTHAIGNMTGTSGRQRVPRECFDFYPVVVPDEATCKKFEKLASDSILMMKANDEQSETLGFIRDALLPKLLSGELRIKDAERFVSKAV